jgi:hypothetical protein
MIINMLSLENKGWELVENAQLLGDELVEEMADSIYFSSNAKPPTADATADKK